MDQHARQRSRGIRTIGRLASSSDDDILLAQWPQPGDTALQRQDVAVASEWAGRSTAAAGRSLREQVDPVGLFDAYDRHQRFAIARLLEAIALEMSGESSGTLVFEAPTTSQHDLLSIIRVAKSRREITPTLACELEARTIAAGESVARLWGLVELYRGGMIEKSELHERSESIKRDHAARHPLTPDYS